MKSVDFTAEFIGELESLPELNTLPMRKLRLKYSKKLSGEDASYVLQVAHSIHNSGKHRWIAYELIHDHDDTIVKALSWALRALVIHNPGEVKEFIHTHEHVLAARIKREVRNKLTTGLKNP